MDKLEVAERQLDAAIRLFFRKDDSVAVHTLAGAAALIITDLVDHHCANRSWDKRCAKDNNLSTKDYVNILRYAQNFFKHAKRDPHAQIEFDQCDTEHLFFMASLNLGEINSLGSLLSEEVSLFQLWYIAKWRDIWNENEQKIEELIRTADKLFPDFDKLSREVQIRRGYEALEALLAKA